MSTSEKADSGAYSVRDDLPTIPDGKRLVVEHGGMWRSLRVDVVVIAGEYYATTTTTHPVLGTTPHPTSPMPAADLAALLDEYGYRYEGR